MTGFGGMCLVLAIIFHSEALHDEVTLVERHRSTSRFCIRCEAIRAG
jgi:hypothetical protein